MVGAQIRVTARALLALPTRWALAGSCAAFVLAGCAVWTRTLLEDPRDASNSSGMYAAGDLILFVTVASALNLLPALVLLHRAAERHARTLTWLLFGLNLTAPLCWAALASGGRGWAWLPSSLHEVVGAALVFLIAPRAIAAPFVLVTCAALRAMIHESKLRRVLLLGLLVEALPMLLVVIHLSVSSTP